MSKTAEHKAKRQDEQIARIERDIDNLEKEIKNTEIKKITAGEVEFEEPITFDVTEIEKFYIRLKRGKIVRLRLNAAQLKILSEINGMSLAGLPVRGVLEKARRFGGSTLLCALGYILMRDHGYRVTIVGHDAKAARTLYGIICLYQERDINASPVIHQTKLEMSVESGGSCWVVTAKRKDIERSVTNQCVIATEYASWEGDAIGLMNALAETVSPFPNTFFFIESTAKGIQNDFYTKCVEAERGKDEFGNPSPWHFTFTGWQDVEEYSMPFRDEAERARFLVEMEHENNAEEKALYYDEGFRLEQLNWRRHKITSMTGPDWATKLANFHQEFPSTWREAFLTTGQTVFTQGTINKWSQISKDTPTIFEGGINYMVPIPFECSTEHGRLEEIIKEGFSRVIGGSLRIWRWPEPFMDYCFGVDVSEGLQDSQYKVDDSAITIIEQETGYQCGAWRGKLPPEYFCDLVAQLARFYAEAYVCVERNMHGRSVIVGMIRAGYPENRMYRREGGSNEAHPTEVDSLGFQTGPLTKPMLMNLGREIVSYNRATILDAVTLGEMSKAQFDKRGICDTGGKDSLMSALLAFKAREQAYPFRSMQRPTEIDPYVLGKMQRREEAERAERQNATSLDRLQKKPAPGLDSFTIKVA